MEIERDLLRKFDEQLEAERCKYKMQLAAIMGRLRGLDQAFKGERKQFFVVVIIGCLVYFMLLLLFRGWTSVLRYRNLKKRIFSLV